MEHATDPDAGGEDVPAARAADGHPRVVVWKVFGAAVSSVPRIRAWTRRQLSRRGVAVEEIDVMELLVSEAAGNAVRHVSGSEIVVLLDVDAHLEAAVRDEEPTPPQPREADLWDTGGRGMTLIQSLADAWGVRVAPVGKWVWFRIQRRPSG